MNANRQIQIISAMLLILSLLLLLNLKSHAQMLGLPQPALEREVTPDTIYHYGDTTVVVWHARHGHFFFFRFQSLRQEWHFHRGVAVYIEGEQTRRDHRRDRRVLRREWQQIHDVNRLGHRTVWMNPDGRRYVKWRE